MKKGYRKKKVNQHFLPTFCFVFVCFFVYSPSEKFLRGLVDMEGKCAGDRDN